MFFKLAIVVLSVHLAVSADEDRIARLEKQGNLQHVSHIPINVQF